MTVRVDVEPELLRWAVSRAGWDAETIRQRAPHFEDWLLERRRPTLKQLERFADATHAPFGLLFLQEPPEEEIPIPDMRTVRNETLRKPSADLLDTIYICQDRQAWYREYAIENGVPAPKFVGAATLGSSTKFVAEQIRTILNFSLQARREFRTWQDAFRALIQRIENMGVLVMVSGIVGSNTHRALKPEEFRGFALADERAPLIFVNGADTKAAQIFTLIHELSHIWLGGSALSDPFAVTANSEPEELWCNKVAAEVLVPIEDLRKKHHGRIDPEALDTLARTYKASTLVVLGQIFAADLISWDTYRETFQSELERVLELSTGRTATGGNYYYTQPLRLSRRFARAVIADTYAGSTSFRDAYQLLGTRKHKTFENLAETLGAE